LIASELPKGQKYGEDYFTSDVFPELGREKKKYKGKKPGETFYIPRDDSKSHNGSKSREQFEAKDLAGSPHPSYSLDLSPCDFWVFGMAERKRKDREFYTIQNIPGYLTEFWNDLTFGDTQPVFLGWQIRLNWVVENGGCYPSEQGKKN
jgi:hypothetical protein